ncbi:MAG: hypothetical protein AB7V16_04075 [Vulcanibacillus sp.]
MKKFLLVTLLLLVLTSLCVTPIFAKDVDNDSDILAPLNNVELIPLE